MKKFFFFVSPNFYYTYLLKIKYQQTSTAKQEKKHFFRLFVQRFSSSFVTRTESIIILHVFSSFFFQPNLLSFYYVLCAQLLNLYRIYHKKELYILMFHIYICAPSQHSFLYCLSYLWKYLLSIECVVCQIIVWHPTRAACATVYARMEFRAAKTSHNGTGWKS